MRRGLCENCGYIGYIDKPSRRWLASFYRDEWDNAKTRNVEAEATRSSSDDLPGTQRAVMERISELRIGDKDKAVCDIGCGTGKVLRTFSREGFSRLIGVETSQYRSEVARKRYELRIFTGNLEDPAIRESLEREGPIGLFFCFHVLEHVFDPAEFLQAAATLQDEGGYLVLAVPNSEREPWIIRLFWLPHLHSFTRTSLGLLLRGAGYEIIDQETTYPDQIVVIARKTAARKKSDQTPSYSVDAMVKSFLSMEGMDPWVMRPGMRYRLQWRNKNPTPEYIPASSSRMIDRLLQYGEQINDFISMRLLGRFTNRRSCVVSGLQKRYANPSDSPLEIQYDEDILLLVR